jgi:sortase A
MPLYSYRKAPSSQSTPFIKPRPSSTSLISNTKKVNRLIPAILVTLGSIMIANVVWPILSYQLFTAPSLKKNEFISPISENLVGNFAPPAVLVNPLKSSPTPQILGQELDYTNPTNWFPSAPFPSDSPKQTAHYTLSIPAVNIKDAQVVIGGEDLKRALIQYPGTALPGQLGSPVIFGHSILRQFYNPSVDNPNRYISIFSKIMTLKPGDEILIDYDGIRYTYRITDKVEVKPEDIFILQQRMNNRELKLITCVPEGTYLRRGVIIAQLVDLQ